MGYLLTEEQQFLKEAATDLYKKAPVALVRTMRDDKDADCFSTTVWQEMIDSGWPGITISETFGGLDFGIRSLGILMEASGRTLSASPLFSASLAGMLLQKYKGQGASNLITDIISGNVIVALAIQEGNFYNPGDPITALQKNDDRYILNGQKSMVVDGHVADHLIINSRHSGQRILLLLDVNQEGVHLEKDFLMDSRYYGHYRFDNVEVSPDQIIIEEADYLNAITDITDWANALLSAELVGIMSEAFDRTISYLKERRQFDRYIGSFQALQHRAADLYGEIELAKSISIRALDAIDNNESDISELCSMAKAKCIKVAQLCTNEGIQMYGGIGMTDDEEIGFFLKRARVAAQTFGGLSYHLDRYAGLNAY